MLAVQARSRGQPLGKLGAAKRFDQLGKLPPLLAAERGPQLTGDTRDILLPHARLRKIKPLQQAMHEAPARRPSMPCPPACWSGRPENALQVVAIATALKLGESGVAESDVGFLFRDPLRRSCDGRASRSKAGDCASGSESALLASALAYKDSSRKTEPSADGVLRKQRRRIAGVASRSSSQSTGC